MKQLTIWNYDMRYILITIALLSFIVIVSGYVQQSHYNPWKYAKNGTYRNPELNLSFEYPVDWEIIQPYGRHGLTILGLEHGEERDNIAVGVLSMPNFTLEEIFDMYRKDEKYIVKGSEIKKIGNRTWGILSIYYYRNGYFFHTICPSYYLFIDLYTKSNDTKLLEIPYRMAESLQCGETNATIP